MKHLIVFTLFLLCLLISSGCTSKQEVKLEIPFDNSEVSKIELYNQNEKEVRKEKTILNRKAIDELYMLFTNISLQEIENDNTESDRIVSFNFVLKDGTCYEIKYIANGVKTGILYTANDGCYYFCRSDISAVWSNLIEENGRT